MEKFLRAYTHDIALRVYKKRVRVLGWFQTFDKNDNTISQVHYLLSDGKIKDVKEQKIKGVLEL
jgi:hypothetical protein